MKLQSKTVLMLFHGLLLLEMRNFLQCAKRAHVYIEKLDHLRDIMVFQLHLEEKTALSDAHLDTLFVWQNVYDASAVGICHILQQDYCFWKRAATYCLSGFIHNYAVQLC